jgi:nitrite reductase/ring-hydroxylating ferredoxin subunit
LTGGHGHPVGRDRSLARLVEDLTAWTCQAFTGATRTHWWSAQDYQSVDDLPLVGPLTPVDLGIYVATGYAKWGMTSAVAASLALTARLVDDHKDWAEVWDSWRIRELGALPRAVSLNASAAVHMAVGWARAEIAAEVPVPDVGSGAVSHRGLRPVATCNLNGTVHKLSAVCPHLKGIVRWNDAEKSWDCPLHGSRFSADGSLLEGPATQGLTTLTSKPKHQGSE